MRATIEQIDKMIGLLKIQRTMLPAVSFFGTNNWNVIDSQLDVLALAKSGHFPSQDDLDELVGTEYEVASWLADTSSSDILSELEENGDE